ncbi:rho GTPase-activating protein 17-like isoform X2 [Cimex lectularius]|uniref:Rho GTPase-activating protein 17 n=1 Tax=Cimex lectularius TaxID=79782 RepID=A0A8I6SNE8_CIMLE|nr:rho GTPase-activating protein 17-like isoform X2 [Cimex lectularius]
MKKQFFRVKQLADQRFSRAEKTEALSYDLVGTEKRIEFFRNVCSTAGKKLGNPSLGPGHDIEKRLKKNPEHLLGHTLIELASRHDDDHLLRQIVTDCGKIQLTLGQSIVSHEMTVESKIIDPLLNVCENDYPNILKHKKTLSKLILDMDSAKTRYIQATKHGNAAPGSKVDFIKEEWEEAEAKVEQCRDTLACEIFQLLSKEAELSATLLQYVILQKQHHDTASAFLNELIVEMEGTIKNCNSKVFGLPLEDHLRVTGRKIAYPIELCVCGIIALTGIAEEGLFRVAPGASKLRRMKLSLDAKCLQLHTALTEYRDPHVFAGVLKSYLRELPEPLLTNALYDQWMAAARVLTNGNTKDGLKAMSAVINSLPQANFDNLHYLIKFFSSLANSKETNKMTPQNIAIVLAPNLIWNEKESESLGINMNVASLHSVIVVTLVTYADLFFPGEMEFFLTIQFNRSEAPQNGVMNEHQNESEVTTDIKRAQSNDSLSDHNRKKQHGFRPSSYKLFCPPQGSPKPAVRSRKHKSTAPTPPVHLYKDDKHQNDEKAKEKKAKEDRPKSKLYDDAKIEQFTKCDKKTDTRESKKEDAETQTPTKAIEQVNLQQASRLNEKLDLPSFDEFSDSERRENCDMSNRKLGVLDKRTSKSGEDVRKVKYTQEGIYATMERKKPPKPAPRTSIDGEKVERPAIPERPANLHSLQRPQSLSFRLNRPVLESSPDGEGRSLERAHMYSVDKKQVAIIQIQSDKVLADNKLPEPKERRESGEKPEKPKKPESLGNQSGHQRAASEGCIIDTGFERRPPRPTPPPPPVVSPTRKESTNL